MKRILLLCLLSACRCLHAAELELELPQPEWLLSPISPPLLQREGVTLLGEQEDAQKLVEFITQQDFAGALAFVREEYAFLSGHLEAGDPDGAARQRVVPGGVMQPASDRVSAAMMYLIGHVYLTLEQYVPAEAAFTGALGPLPDYARVHESLGLLYLETERFDDAQTHLARALALGLNTANLFGALGYLNQNAGNFWGAVGAYQQASMMEPGNTQWQQGLLYALSNSRQADAALTLAEAMLLEDPDDVGLWLYRSEAALQTDRREVALSSLETALRLGDEGVATLQVCAALHMEIGSIERAVDLLGAALPRGLDFQYADQALLWLAQQGEWEQLRELLAALEANAGTLDALQRSQVLTHTARLGVQEGNASAAIKSLESALELNPANPDALLDLAAIRSADRDYNRAELLYQRASALPSHRESALLALAQLAIDQDNFARALDLLQEIVRGNPARSDLRGNIASLESLVLLQE